MIPLQTASRHPVSHIVYSSDGAAVAVAQPHYGVTILDRATGRTLAVCAMPRHTAFTSLTFCGDGKYLAASHAKGLEVFDASTGARVASGFRFYFASLHLTERDGAVFGLGSRTIGFLWRPDPPNDDGFHHANIRSGHGSMALSPDARFTLKPVSNYRVKLHDVDANRDVAEIERPDDSDSEGPGIGKFCPLGRRFALNDGCTVDVYDAQVDEGDQHTHASLTQHNGDSVAVAPMPHTLLSSVFKLKPETASEAGKWYPPFALLGDGRGLLVKRPRNRIQWWDAPTGTVVNEWSWRFEWVTCVAASADGLTAVAGGRFGRVILWDLE
jgi:WD40 repeat protein